MSQTHNRVYRLDFPALMRQCEDNYGLLMALMPVLEEQDEWCLALPAAGKEERHVTLRVLDRCRYTTELRLDVDGPHPLLPPASLTVRLYHDACLAEVVASAPHARVPARHDYPNARMHQRDEKHQWNRHLGEWLRHLREHGHARLESLARGWRVGSGC